MNLTRRARSLLADPRRELMGVLMVMFLVLTVLGVQALCTVHLDEAGHGTPVHGAVEQHAAVGVISAPAHATEEGAGHHGEGPSDCSEDRTATARYDRTLSPSTDLAGAPDLAMQWWVPEIAQRAPQVPSGVVAVAAPSLHALGISRT